MALGWHADFTALGHVTALLLGMLVAPDKIEIPSQSGAVKGREELGSRSP